MAQQYYSMDQIAKLAKVSQQQVYYLINMKFKFKPTLVDPKGNKFYDERAVGQIFQDLGKVLPKSVVSPATDNGLLDINAIAETTGIGKKKLRVFIREHKEIKPDFIDEKNHNKKYWGPSAIQYIHDHFEAEEAAKAKPEEAKAAEATVEEKPVEEKVQETEVKVEEAPKAEAKEEKTEEAPVIEPVKTEEKVELPEEVKEEPEEKKVTGPVFVKKAPRPDDKLKEHPAVELPFSFDDQEAKPEVDEKAEAAETTAKVEEKTEAVETPKEVKEEKAEAKPEKTENETTEEDHRGFVVRKRDDEYRNNRRQGRNNRQNGYHQNNRQGYQKNNYQNNRQQNYAKRRELFEGKFKLVTEKGTFYTDQFKSLDELAEYVLSSKGEFMKVEKYNRGEFVPAYISTKSIIEFEEA
ncbi:Putative uncharacterized protein [Lactobacillus equicursoris DSM 19284 = JCM 14600 = CIP 110162]|uniref:Uncharacterized protein n=1 Tax=Lactobacillus equicursoris DSM 19284 = JCM 14600 = CIP 110162 TaxID=1293597 RepID=K0NKU3_9LACO|nr:hypothetical protein [Lactobacillus equicursoris]KRL02638.1 hypothetical protein FC20_GL000197 [Lactobacillus equicursoris DSM 19284 = JCM 14600 = CIP 110162]CCK85972.1 Putative uncharacterized protein [Lactobacillus equicursoris DSM 19284 = JCM 14600 = CIP 110162]